MKDRERMDDRQIADEMAKELQYGLTHLTIEPEMLWCQMCGRYQPAGDEPKMVNVCHHCGATIVRAPKTDKPLWGYVEEGERQDG